MQIKTIHHPFIEIKKKKGTTTFMELFHLKQHNRMKPKQ